MSKEENRGMINAYEKMLKDGTAFKKVDMTMHTEPDIAVAAGERKESIELTRNPLGERVDEMDDGSYTEFDSMMEQRINSLRNKMGGARSGGVSGNKSTQQEILSLKKRVKQLEEALMLVMETHEKLLG